MKSLESLGEALALAGFAAAHPKHPKIKSLRRRFTLPAHAGIVEQRTCRMTGYKVGLYRSVAAGIETDPELPWSTVCEEHGNVVCHPTLACARASLAVPDWCMDCQPKITAYLTRKK